MKRWIALGTVVVALAIVWLFWSPNRVPELQRVPINSQDTLVVHAFLDQPTDSIQLASNDSIRHDGTGIKIVMSFRSTDSERDSDWSWLKYIQIRDKTDSSVSVYIASFNTIRTNGGSMSTKPPDRQQRRDGITYCSVIVPKVETEGPCQYHLVNVDDQAVATIVSPLAPSIPSAEFNSHPHQLETTSGPWRAKVLGMSLGRATKGSIQDGRYYYTSPPEKLWFEYDGQVMQKNEVAVVDVLYSDALGNESIDSQLPPDLQPRWKMSMKVGRIDYMAHRNSPELKYIGRFDDIKSILELALTDPVPGVGSVVCFGLGNHQFSISNKGRTERNFHNYRAGFFGHRNVMGNFPISSSGSGDGDSWKFDVTYAAFSQNDNHRINLGYHAEASIGTKMTVHATLPLIAVNLQRPLVNQIINIFAFDQLNRPLKVNSVAHTIPQMPLYIIETDTDTQFLELYASIEDLVPLEMYFVPPTRGVEFPPTNEDFSYLSLAPSPDGWIRQ